MKKFQISYLFYTIFLDFLAIFLSFNSLYLIRQSSFVQNWLGLITETSNFMSYSDFSFFVLKAIFLFYLIMFLVGGYSFAIKDRLKHHFAFISKACLLWSSFTFLYFLLMQVVPFSRSIVIFSFFLSFFTIVFFRKLFLCYKNKLASLDKNKLRVLIISSDKGKFNDYLNDFLKDSRYSLVSVLANFDCDAKFDSFSTFQEFVNSSLKVDVIVDLDSREYFMKSEILSYARFNQIEYSFVPGIHEFRKFNFQYDFEHNFSELTLIPSKLNGWHLVLKRGFDIIGSLILILILSPFFAIVAILIKLESKGPVFFINDDFGNPIFRIGQNKNPFIMYKFRTMRNKSHSLRYTDLSDRDFRKDSPMVKIKNDPRVTKLGAFLRRFDIDELPQLFNVLLGDMSFVGPRPHLEEEVLKYQDHHNFVFTIKPGITGLPQISGRSDLDFEEEIILDSNYIQNWTFLLDLKILFKTPFVVFIGHGEQSNVAKK